MEQRRHTDTDDGTIHGGGAYFRVGDDGHHVPSNGPVQRLSSLRSDFHRFSAQIGAAAKVRSRTCQHNPGDGIILCTRRQDFRQIFIKRVVVRVPNPWTIQGDKKNGVGRATTA